MSKYHVISRQNNGVLELSLPVETQEDYDALTQEADERGDVRDHLTFPGNGFRECVVCELRVSYTLSVPVEMPEEVAV